MKRWIPMVVAMLSLPLLWGCGIAVFTQADDGSASYAGDMDVSYFYDALAPYGDWIWTDAYGWVWSPYDEPVDWRPYTDGEWVWTDDGWTWVADQEWGWAPFHYGRWYDDATYGWCWVPGEEWAPAWVAWREGDGWIGWAPLPPEVTWSDTSGFGWSDWDHLPGVRHHWWSFCKESEFARPDLQSHLAPRHRGVIRIKDTRNITKYEFLNSQIVNRSFDLERIRKADGGDIRSYRIADLSTPPGRGARRPSRNELFVYRQRLREAPLAKTPQKVRVPRPAPTPIVVRPPESGAGPAPAPSVERDPREQRRREALDLQRRHGAERKELKDQTRQDQQQPPPGISAEELRRQQQEQQRALEEQIARDRRVLEARQEEEQRRLREQRDRETEQLQQRQLEEQRQREQQERERQQLERQRQEQERQRQQLEQQQQERQRQQQEQQRRRQGPPPEQRQDQRREPNQKVSPDKGAPAKPAEPAKDQKDRPDRKK